jgi:serine/threonine-protein kinase
MGEVYRARDLRLERDVALKILPISVANDAERVARFRREAHLLASLNHPNIATIHGFEEAAVTAPGGAETNDIHALVLELVDGPTLADRIAQGPLPIDEACRIAQQIAEALEAAHAQGIIHRDLKPANIKLTAEDKVKVLDFGLAKAFDSMSSGGGQLSHDVSISPTITSPAMTRIGVILGTAAYMAPEQARGKPVDKRADVWAFGCVLYEMLTGRRVFAPASDGRAGRTAARDAVDEVTDTLASVLTKEPDLTALPANTPSGLRRLLRRCLEKDRTHRLADMADARLELEEALTSRADEAPALRVSTPAASRWSGALPWTFAAVSLAVAVAIAGWTQRSRDERPALSTTRVTTDLDVSGAVTGFALSPDGTKLVVASQAGPTTRLQIRRLNELNFTVLNGTEGALAPFFSPDGQWIGFFANGRLMKVASTGGAVIAICDAPGMRGATWSRDGETIVFQAALAGSLSISVGPLLRVPAGGGAPVEFSKAPSKESNESHRWPHMLPNGRAVLYSAGNVATGFNDGTIMVQPFPSGDPKVLYRGGFAPRYVASGHLVFLRGTTLFAAPFDLDRLELTAPPVPILDQIATDPIQGQASFDVSATGTVVYQTTAGDTASTGAPIVWIDRAGKITNLRAEPSIWGMPRFSPDGRTLALAMTDRNQTDIWTYDLSRDTTSRLTFDPSIDVMPVWTPDGRRLVYGSQRDGATNLYWQRADGTGEAQRLTASPIGQLPSSWHPNGRLLAFYQGVGVDNKQDIMILPIEGDETSGWKPGKPVEFLGGPFRKVWPMFSPDGRWIAYTSNESGRFEIYVRPYPGPGGKWQVSNGGGAEPFWSAKRHELLFTQAAPAADSGTQLMVAAYSTSGDSFRVEKPVPWTSTRIAATTPIGTYGRALALHPDGDRFAAMALQPTATPRRFVFVFNFFEELRQKAKPAR